jgi:hypothetical protein
MPASVRSSTRINNVIKVVDQACHNRNLMDELILVGLGARTDTADATYRTFALPVIRSSS